MVRISSKLSRRTAVAFLAPRSRHVAFLALATARLRSRTVEAGNGMRRIALTIENYKLATGYSPSATQISDDGRHFHSWRIRAIGHMCRIDYRGAYDFDRPWNSPGNVDLGHGPLMGKAAEVRIRGPAILSLARDRPVVLPVKTPIICWSPANERCRLRISWCLSVTSLMD